MGMMRRESRLTLRSLPSVERVLQSDVACDWLMCLPRRLLADLVREAISEVRSAILGGGLEGDPEPMDAVVDHVDHEVGRLTERSLKAVINATGVILHTNLGRAPLGEHVVEELQIIAGSYCNLEYDLVRGRRGQRDEHCGALLERLLGRPAIVVNNNAAAVFLALRELASDGEVIVSRGELVEIGGGFRIPDILAESGAVLREVGTTNRTRADDYRRAVGPSTRALLRVHPSNFRQEGFTEKPSVAALAEVARSASVPLVEDLGSGCLVDLDPFGIEGEPTVASSLKEGVNLVTFSGDKLLGGPQAGILAGDRQLIDRIRRNPLFRALRVDKLILAALGATLRAYVTSRLAGVPAVVAIRQSQEHLANRAEALVKLLVSLGVEDVGVVPGVSVVGGGSTPMRSLPSMLVSIGPGPSQTAQHIERRLRTGAPPVVARIEQDRVLLDLRTVFPHQTVPLAEAVEAALRPDVRTNGSP